MKQYITFNFIIELKEKLTYRQNNDRDFVQIGILIACRNWEIMLLKYR